MSVTDSSCLRDRLAEALPLNSQFHVYHLSSPPTPCSSIYSAPPGLAPEKTFCESHFLSATVRSDQNQIQVFALEVLIYTTEYLTTLFVSKADSTGYLHLLNLPKGTPSPLKTISQTFLAFLIEKRRRSNRKLVLSLFARAQDQYLFPGSIENPRKHVLDDRGLVKWWCQVLDPILQQYPSMHEESVPRPGSVHGVHATFTSQGFLRVPGCDLHETRAFFPRNAHDSANREGRWKVSDPLRDLRQSAALPERCLIPRFPDDPKARYVDELDDELPEPSSQTQQSPSRGQRPGRWRSVRSLEQFWEMMAFRQECSSGRLVGFIWGVITPLQPSQDEIEVTNSNDWLSSPSEWSNGTALPTPVQSQIQDGSNDKDDSPLRLSPAPDISFPPSSSATSKQKLNASIDTGSSKVISKKNKHYSGPVINREPRSSKSQPEKTKYYFWAASGRGEIILREKDYQRVNKLMLNLDYANEEIATKSTVRWINDVAVVGRVEKWGYSVEGRRQVQIVSQEVIESKATMLDLGLMRKKKRRNEDDDIPNEQASVESMAQKVNILPIGLVRKKVKMSDYPAKIP